MVTAWTCLSSSTGVRSLTSRSLATSSDRCVPYVIDRCPQLDELHFPTSAYHSARSTYGRCVPLWDRHTCVCWLCMYVQLSAGACHSVIDRCVYYRSSPACPTFTPVTCYTATLKTRTSSSIVCSTPSSSTSARWRTWSRASSSARSVVRWSTARPRCCSETSESFPFVLCRHVTAWSVLN